MRDKHVKGKGCESIYKWLCVPVMTVAKMFSISNCDQLQDAGGNTTPGCWEGEGGWQTKNQGKHPKT